MGIKKKAGCAFGLLFGSFIRLFVTLVEVVVRFLAGILVFFGLWIPFLYALVGVVLFLTLKFNPFDWGIEGQLFIAGFVASCVCSLVITVRNLIIKPVRSTVQGFVNPVWQKKAERENEELGRHNRKVRQPKPQERPAKRLDKESAAERHFATVTPAPTAATEKPEIYYSRLEDDLLVHEFSDRFELYRMIGNKAKLERVEYK